jgi:hypothetical protein
MVVLQWTTEGDKQIIKRQVKLAKTKNDETPAGLEEGDWWGDAQDDRKVSLRSFVSRGPGGANN